MFARYVWMFGLLSIEAVGFGQNYDLTVRPISSIRPGTEVSQGPPAGWTHLIIKSRPQVTSGDVSKAPQRDIDLASLLYTALVARVDQTPSGWQLSDVATGCGTSIGGRDIIITSATQQQLGADLGFFARMVLKEFDRKQSEAVFKARGRNFAIVDTVGAFRWDNQNCMLPLRYAIVVHPQTGQLDAFCLLLSCDPNGNSNACLGRLHWLPQSLIFTPQLFVDKSKYNFMGIPSDTAFCSTNLPPGQISMDIPADAAGVLCKPALTGDEAASLHRWFAAITEAMRNPYNSAALKKNVTQR